MIKKAGGRPLKLLYQQALLRYSSEVRNLSPYAPNPRIVLLELSSLCNLHCPKCALKATRREKGLMPAEKAMELIDRCSEISPDIINLSMLGEPLLHPEAERIVSYASGKGFPAGLTTNAILLAPERSKKLLQAGIKLIVVSIDGWDRESNAKRQHGADLDKMLFNLNKLREMRGKSAKPRIVANTIWDRECLEHLSEIKALLAPYVDDIRPIPLIDFGVPGHEIDPALVPGTRSWKRVPCRYLWNILSIGWDGAVTACCSDYAYMLKYHHVDLAPLSEIWNSEKIRKWRELHIEGRFNEMPMCGRCTKDYLDSFAFYRLKDRFHGIEVS
ncbi:MAG: radical SAM protein [bacterium]